MFFSYLPWHSWQMQNKSTTSGSHWCIYNLRGTLFHQRDFVLLFCDNNDLPLQSEVILNLTFKLPVQQTKEPADPRLVLVTSSGEGWPEEVSTGTTGSTVKDGSCFNKILSYKWFCRLNADGCDYGKKDKKVFSNNHTKVPINMNQIFMSQLMEGTWGQLQEKIQYRKKKWGMREFVIEWREEYTDSIITRGKHSNFIITSHCCLLQINSTCLDNSTPDWLKPGLNNFSNMLTQTEI